MKIAIITAGGAGMFCGSCMQDNTLARALQNAGHDVTLIPTYTPITVDEENVSDHHVFLGGVNVYLDSVVPGWSRLPRFLKGWLDRPAVLQRLTRRSSSTDASRLGWLTVDMLKGIRGPQRNEIRPLVSWLTEDLQPDVILFSNALLSGIVPALREQFSGAIACLLQGDDIFLDALPDRWRQTALDLVKDNCRHFDRLLTHSHWYADYLAESLELPRDRMEQIPLSLDCHLPESLSDDSRPSDQHTIGYFARICPEKGIDHFLEAAERVADQNPALRFLIAGYLPDLHADWFRKRLSRTQQTVPGDRVRWLGSPETRDAKFQILQQFDVLCVPTSYREPKGIFMLEAALVGVPALVPNHGAFPERIADLGHGWTYTADSPESLDQALLASPDRVDAAVSERLRQAVREHYATEVTGPEISHVLERLTDATQAPS